MKLYTFALSHFSEKVRFALDAGGLQFEDVALTPVLHLPRALLLSRGRGTSVPILEADGQRIQDSTRILSWLEIHRAPFSPIPSDPKLRAEAFEIEERVDRLGPHIIRFCYAKAVEDPRALMRLWTARSTPSVAGVLERASPLLPALLRRRFRIVPEKVEISRHKIEALLTSIDAQLADGRQYLVGDRLTIADITVASLLGPLVMPPEHPIWGLPEYRESLGGIADAWADRTTFEFARRLYRFERRARA